MDARSMLTFIMWLAVLGGAVLLAGKLIGGSARRAASAL